MDLLRVTQAKINLDALQNNVEKVSAQAQTEVMAVIKADAYGHGAPAMMHYMLGMGVKYFAVASINEAVELRQRNTEGEVLILGHTPDAMLRYIPEYNLTQTVFSFEQAQILSSFGLPAKIQLKLDTGMHRLGFMPTEQSLQDIARIFALPNLEIVGIYSHLALNSREADFHQFEVFKKFTDEMAARGLNVRFRHICDGIGNTRYPEMHLDMVRPGGAFYGFNELPGLQPVMTLRSQIARVHRVPAGEGVGYDLLQPADHDRMIATLPFGYSDGVPRMLSRGVGHVVVRGKKAPFVGILCMDMCMADVTDIEGVSVDDEVMVIGGHEEAMSFPDVARLCDMNRNGVQSNIPRRVPRLYMRGGKVLEYREL